MTSDISEQFRFPLISSASLEIADLVRSAVDFSPAEREVGKSTAEYWLWEEEGRVFLQLEIKSEPKADSESSEVALLGPLDRMAWAVLSDQGNWNSELKAWEFTGSDSLKIVFELLRILPTVRHRGTRKRLQVDEQLVKVALAVTWRVDGAHLTMSIVDQKETGDSFLLGESPYLILISDKLYRLAPESRSLAALFKRTSRLFISSSNLIPLLRLWPFKSELVHEINEEHRPELRFVEAQTVLNFLMKPSVGNEEVCLIAELGFRYGSTGGTNEDKPPVIEMPKQLSSGEVEGQLEGLGFCRLDSPRKWKISGDLALDLVEQGNGVLPDQWEVNGLEEISKQLKIAKVEIKIELKRIDSGDGPELFECGLLLLQNGVSIPFRNLFRSSFRSSRAWVKLVDGAYAKVPFHEVEQLTYALGLSESSLGLGAQVGLPVTPAQVVTLISQPKGEFELSLDSHCREFTERFQALDDVSRTSAPKGFVGDLRDYQLKGLAWLRFLGEFGFGGILADEMGLGKTVQTLALLQSLKEQAFSGVSDQPSLIVCPTSVLRNWENEVKKFTPGLRVLVLHGADRREFFSDIEAYDLVLTTYPLVRIDQSHLRRIRWEYVILDEAQYIKNVSSSTTRSVKALKSNCRLALTGTPTENRPLELWSIMDFLIPGFLGTKDSFIKRFERKILARDSDRSALDALKFKVSPFILRRTKAEVEKELPPKIESDISVEMSPVQTDLYNQIASDLKENIISDLAKVASGQKRFSILTALMKLRQVCNHPRSLRGYYDRVDLDSGKFELFKSLLTEALENNRKILVFCQFLEMLKIMRSWLESEELAYCYLDGAVRERQELIDHFNNEDSCRVFLISLKAGGTGLNLISADMVIIYDPWWNPAVENQAIDRAHRIGQVKVVNVYRLVTQNSIEERIFRLKDSKSRIFSELISPTASTSRIVSEEALETLFSLAPLPSELPSS